MLISDHQTALLTELGVGGRNAPRPADGRCTSEAPLNGLDTPDLDARLPRSMGDGQDAARLISAPEQLVDGAAIQTLYPMHWNDR